MIDSQYVVGSFR